MNAILIFATVFLPVGWFIYRMIRYTAKTVGDESPLATVVTYKIEDWDYFIRFDFLVLGLLTWVSLYMMYVMLFMAIPTATAYWHWLICLGCLASSFYGLWYVVLIFRLDWQYWLITRGKTVTLNPADKSLEIATSDETVCFTVAEVDVVEKHGPGLNSGKLVAGYRYFIFKLKDGRWIYLNHNKSYLDFAIDDYFKTVPIQYVPHKIPWIVAP